MDAFRALVATTWTGIGKRAVEGGLICLFFVACNRARLSRFEPGEQHQIVRHHGGPDVGLEVVQSAPVATGGTLRALEAGDRRLDAGAKIPQTTVDPRALDHLGNGDAALFVEGDVGNAAGLGGGEIGAAGVATIGSGLPRRCAGAGNMAIEHRHKALGIGRIAGFDDDVKDQSAFAGRQVELVSVLNLTTTFDDDVGVRLEQADQLLTGRHYLAVKHAASGLGNNTRYQRQVMCDLGTPALGSDLGRRRSRHRTAGAPGSASPRCNSRVMTRTASDNSVLSLGSCIRAEVTVLSSRTVVPLSSRSCLALANKAWLIASQVSARSAAIVWCSTDFFGDHRNGRRAKAQNEAESSR